MKKKVRVPSVVPKGTHLGEKADLLTEVVTSMDRAGENRRGVGGIMHASDIVGGICPRRVFILKNYEVEGAKLTWSGQRIIWALGRAAEQHVRHQFISASASNCYGWWDCNCGSISFLGRPQDNTDRCSACCSRAKNYREVTLSAYDGEQLLVVGHPDLVLVVDGVAQIVEIKSLRQKAFEVLARPEADHIVQASIYAYLLHHDPDFPWEVSEYVRVFYVAKDAMKGSPYKEFTHPATQYQAIAREGLEKIREGHGDEIPERLSQCSSPQSSIAKGCDCCNLCFSLHE